MCEVFSGSSELREVRSAFRCLVLWGSRGDVGVYKDAQLLKTFRNISLKSSALALDQK